MSAHLIAQHTPLLDAAIESYDLKAFEYRLRNYAARNEAIHLDCPRLSPAEKEAVM